MMRLFLGAAICLALGSGAQAQDNQARFAFGGDLFVAGRTIVHQATGVDDLFAAGQRLRVDAPITGSLHAAGQTLTLGGDVGGDVYALGQDISLAGDVAGDVSVAGEDLRIDGGVGADLRAVGSVIELRGPVGGSAILGGEDVVLDATIGGDVALAAEEVVFGAGARIAGRLDLYEEDPGTIEVPTSVVPEDRITRHEIEEWTEDQVPDALPSARDLIGRFVVGVVMVALLAALTAGLVPGRLAQMRRTALAAPFRTLGVGFLSQSAIVGSVFLVAMTLIGLILVPAILLLSGLTMLGGYVVGAYAFGVGLILLVGRDEPDSLAERAIAAGIGAFVAGILALIPFLGWIFVLGLALTGLGAIVQSLFGQPAKDTV